MVVKPIFWIGQRWYVELRMFPEKSSNVIDDGPGS
jgi:hypothetical protein